MKKAVKEAGKNSDKKVNKKGQISFFIIIAISIIILLLVFFFMQSRENASFKTDSIRIFVENCIKDTGNRVVYKIGTGGGYYFPANFSTLTGVAYYYADGKNYMPLKSDIEKEISYYLEKELFFCTKNFKDFPDFEVKQGLISVESKILDDKVVFNVNYPLSVSKGENTIKFEKFSSEIPVRLGILYDSADSIIKEQLSHEDVCLNCLLQVSVKNDFYVNMLDYDNETVIFIFKDENSKIDEIPFKLAFANKYKIKEVIE